MRRPHLTETLIAAGVATFFLFPLRPSIFSECFFSFFQLQLSTTFLGFSLHVSSGTLPGFTVALSLDSSIVFTVIVPSLIELYGISPSLSVFFRLHLVPTGFYLIIFDSTRFLASFTPILPSLIGFFYTILTKFWRVLLERVSLDLA